MTTLLLTIGELDPLLQFLFMTLAPIMIIGTIVLRVLDVHGGSDRAFRAELRRERWFRAQEALA
jgi:hypothetical protein